MIDLFNFNKKKILVTGASSGIGKATSILLSKLGAKIIMIAQNKERLDSVTKELDAQGHRWYSYNLKEISGINLLIKTIVEENGTLDGFVHCAGISSMRPLKMTKYDFLHDMMLINFYSFVELVRVITRKGNYNNGLSIVGMSSVSGIKGLKSKTAYSASKAALDGAIRAISKELHDKKIRINSIIAGLVKTEMFEKYKSNIILSGKINDIERGDINLPEPDDIARSITFLLSDSAKYINGTNIIIDSGLKYD